MSGGKVVSIAVMTAVAGFGVLADRITKVWALDTLGEVAMDDYSWFGGLLRLRLAFNTGAAFGMGAGSTVVFSVLSLTAALLLIIFALWKLRHWWQGALFGLLLAGIGGNLIDRLTREPGSFRGSVIDFIAVKWFAVFNVADICITCGALLLCCWMIIAERRKVGFFSWLPLSVAASDRSEMIP
ncbi:MAG: signal peptidase II [Propionibacteriaceae bacterium]|jgi:signal peptidase II|nr:signal peptidase II [Propionibacteriaceae bacterium]